MPADDLAEDNEARGRHSAADGAREERSPLAPVTGAQVSAYNFLRRRDQAAITEAEVDMATDAGHRDNAFLVLASVMFIGAIVACGVLAWLRPVGRVDESQIVADGDNRGAVYVLVRGKLHPAENLVSAQLIVGQPTKPATVKTSVINKYPPGPKVGIVGGPQAFTPRGAEESRWSLCDTAPAASSDPSPTVTALAGRLTLGGRASALATDSAVLAEHAGSTYVVWGGKRSRIDLSNRPLALALGIDSSAAAPVRMSNALFDSIPATEALATPQIPQAGTPPRWNVAPGAAIGSVMKVSDLAGGGDELYVLLADGLQKVEPFVASLLMSSSPSGQMAPLPMPSKTLAAIPAVKSLRVDYYPPRRLTLVDTKAFPVLCVAWSKGVTDREAVTTVISGKGLPIPVSEDAAVTTLVRNDRRPNSVEAHQVWVDPDAANLVTVTSADPRATSRESLYYISREGVRYGISEDGETLRSLGIDPKSQAVQAPWPLIQVYAPGPSLSRQSALVSFDSVAPPPIVAAVKPQ
ncbi:type VII secretion protein EccB [Mycobacteroides chelonae]|uniref:type VII secretion protein EccB n=1 Tax=Mycobacteroides chelonae TaxID=1774 RepID=UPI0039ED24C9